MPAAPSDDFVARWAGRVIDIHHSFLPAFVGAKPYHQARARDVVRCSHRDTIDDLVRRGRDLERQVLARAVSWHLDDRVILHGNTTVVFD